MIFRYLENFLGRYLLIDIMSKPLLRLPSNSLHCFNTLISPIIFLLFFEITIITFWCFWETLRKFYDEIYAHTIGPKVLTILFRFGELFFAIKKQANPIKKAFGRKRPAPIKSIGIRKSILQYVLPEIVRYQKCRPFALMKRGGRVLALCHEPSTLLVRYSVCCVVISMKLKFKIHYYYYFELYTTHVFR